MIVSCMVCAEPLGYLSSPGGWRHTVRGVGGTLADLTLARGGPTLATLVHPLSDKKEELFAFLYILGT